MPPEVFGSERYGHGVDIFAAGVVEFLLVVVVAVAVVVAAGVAEFLDAVHFCPA